MAINILPKGGINFKATLGAGSFQRKLSGATRYGDLKNLRDNQKVIVDTVKKYQGVIRTKGGLSRLQQRDAWLKMKASDKTITKEDKREIQAVLKHLGRGTAMAQGKTAVVDRKAVKTSDARSYLTKEQITRNLRSRTQRDEITRGEVKTSFAGGRVESHGVIQRHGAMGDIGVSRGSVGFAANYKNSQSPNNSVPKAPLAGTKPVGL